MSQASSGRTVMVQGRIVWTSGDLFKGRQKTDLQTRQPRRNQAGEVMMEYGLGLSIPKSAFAQPGVAGAAELWQAMHDEAYILYPSRQVPPQFAMKYKDGDGIDDKGVPFSNREGYGQSLVFAMTTTIPIKFFRFDAATNTNLMINEGIKCGDYVNVQLQIKSHAAQGQGKPGLYLNPQAVQFLGYGKEIVNKPSGDQIFGQALPPMPPGASALPTAPQGQTQLLATAPGGFAPLPSAPMGAPPMAAPVPHYGVLPPVHQPPPGGQVIPMSPPSYPQPLGNAPAPGAYPAPGAAPTPMAAPMAPSFATPASPPVPGWPQQ